MSKSNQFRIVFFLSLSLFFCAQQAEAQQTPVAASTPAVFSAETLANLKRLQQPALPATTLTGRTIINVFTEPQWRRHEIVGLLIKGIVAWSKSERLDRLILHASDEGRSLYEKFGFVASNEMRLSRGQLFLFP
jgi:Acetyltransferase (GNAT) domain